jgi:hypothetical protein
MGALAVTNLASISANLIEALRGIANGSGLRDRVPMMDAGGTPDLGRTIRVDEALAAAAQGLPDDERFTEAQFAIVDAACAKLRIKRPSDLKKAGANAVAEALVRAGRS